MEAWFVLVCSIWFSCLVIFWSSWGSASGILVVPVRVLWMCACWLVVSMSVMVSMSAMVGKCVVLRGWRIVSVSGSWVLMWALGWFVMRWL